MLQFPRSSQESQPSHGCSLCEQRLVVATNGLFSERCNDVMDFIRSDRPDRAFPQIGESERDARLRISQTLPGTAAAVVKVVRAAGLEAVIAKRKDSIYEPGERSADWVKLKLERQQEVVVGGYRPGGSAGIDAALALGCRCYRGADGGNAVDSSENCRADSIRPVAGRGSATACRIPWVAGGQGREGCAQRGVASLLLFSRMDWNPNWNPIAFVPGTQYGLV
jgi:hypothetical protein